MSRIKLISNVLTCPICDSKFVHPTDEEAIWRFQDWQMKVNSLLRRIARQTFWALMRENVEARKPDAG